MYVTNIEEKTNRTLKTNMYVTYLQLQKINLPTIYRKKRTKWPKVHFLSGNFRSLSHPCHRGISFGVSYSSERINVTQRYPVEIETNV